MELKKLLESMDEGVNIAFSKTGLAWTSLFVIIESFLVFKKDINVNWMLSIWPLVVTAGSIAIAIDLFRSKSQEEVLKRVKMVSGALFIVATMEVLVWACINIKWGCLIVVSWLVLVTWLLFNRTQQH
ncbi:hypothetical protein [Thermococcus sp.]|uniref:hypothetical protein n=1 Tax=Thermococcus sp. TaxID=35749 RepID=UPI00262BC6A9|nr:hypothetical protein [Thermococcus sp.]